MKNVTPPTEIRKRKTSFPGKIFRGQATYKIIAQIAQFPPGTTREDGQVCLQIDAELIDNILNPPTPRPTTFGSDSVSKAMAKGKFDPKKIEHQ